MSVGIYDADLSTFALVPFNLEAMKLSAYYKKKGGATRQSAGQTVLKIGRDRIELLKIYNIID